MATSWEPCHPAAGLLPVHQPQKDEALETEKVQYTLLQRQHAQRLARAGRGRVGMPGLEEAGLNSSCVSKVGPGVPGP